MKLLKKSKRQRVLNRNNILLGFVLGLCLFSNSFGQTKADSTGRNLQCPPNPDGKYDRVKVLQQLIVALNDSIPEYTKFFPAGFGLKGDRPRAFFLYDLTDPSNTESNGGCTNLIEHHVYHLSPSASMFSFSHILFLNNGSIKVFKSINCAHRGDSLSDVLKYLDSNLPNDDSKRQVIERVRKYREFGHYWFVDDPDLRCEDVNRKLNS
jgi:hypothetical protein